MDFECHERKPMLYADLFKPQKVIINSSDNNTMMMSELGSSSSFSSNQSSSFCDTSSSGLSSPFDSELESNDGDFMAELTRQMAEGIIMPQGDDDDDDDAARKNSVLVFEENSKNYGSNQGCTDYAAVNNLKTTGLYPNPFYADDRTPPLQVYELKNQPPVGKQSASVTPDKRFKGTELTQHKPTHYNVQVQYKRGRDWAGSGMQAVFLGGPGSKIGSTSGTGVFLPRVNNNPAEPKKKSGCSTVLIPTRVLQALEIHFKRRSDSLVPPLIGGCGSPNHSSPKDELAQTNDQQNRQSKFENPPTDNLLEEMQLPQEWTY